MKFGFQQPKISSKTYCTTYVADFYSPISFAFLLVPVGSLNKAWQNMIRKCFSKFIIVLIF